MDSILSSVPIFNHIENHETFPRDKKYLSTDYQKFMKRSLENRTELCRSITRKHQDCIPVVLDIDENISFRKDKKYYRFIVSKDCEFGSFQYSFRNKLIIPSTEAIYFFIDNNIINGKFTFSQIYRSFRERDGFLHITVKTEETYGYLDLLK
jgi:hypothetical protein